MSEFNIKFREMTDDEFNKFLEGSILSYSTDLVRAGMYSAEAAFINSKEQFNLLLPQGNYTQNQYLYIIENNENEDLGHIWYEKNEENIAFICNFFILEKFRKKGYGRQALLLVEKDAKSKDFNKIFLHVFKFNDNAISLYKSIGYKVFQEESGGMYLVKDI